MVKTTQLGRRPLSQKLEPSVMNCWLLAKNVQGGFHNFVSLIFELCRFFFSALVLFIMGS